MSIFLARHLPWVRLGRARGLASWRREWAKVRHGAELLKDETKLSIENLQKGDPDRRILKKTALDMARVVPFLGVAALPGGMVLAPMLAKVAPWALPSTFGLLMQSEKTFISEQATDEDRRMRERVRRALDDLRMRAKARPGEEDELFHQLEDVLAHPDAEHLHFERLYTLTDRALLKLLDDDTVGRLAKQLRVHDLSSTDSRHADRHQMQKDILQHLSRIRAEDLLLLDQLDSIDRMSDQELELLMRRRGMESIDNGRREALKAWVNMTAHRALPVSLVAFSFLSESSVKHPRIG